MTNYEIPSQEVIIEIGIYLNGIICNNYDTIRDFIYNGLKSELTKEYGRELDKVNIDLIKLKSSEWMDSHVEYRSDIIS